MSTKTSSSQSAIIAGVGPGLGASVARGLAERGYRVAGIARSREHISALEGELGGVPAFAGIAADVTDPDAMRDAAARVEAELGPIEVYVHNASTMLRRPFLELESDDLEAVWRVTVLGGFNGAKAVLPAMTERGAGTILFTGATGSLRGGANFAAFASAKFGLRGLAQSLAREFGPQGIHVAHVIIDGVIRGRSSQRLGLEDEACLDARSIAQTYLDLIAQDKSAWTHEIDLRPFGERF